MTKNGWNPLPKIDDIEQIDVAKPVLSPEKPNVGYIT